MQPGGALQQQRHTGVRTGAVALHQVGVAVNSVEHVLKLLLCPRCRGYQCPSEVVVDLSGPVHKENVVRAALWELHCIAVQQQQSGTRRTWSIAASPAVLCQQSQSL